jgi:regulator of RNase E activity RraA
MVPASDKESPKPAQHFVDAVPQGSVVCISQPDNMVNAVWGGLMTARAMNRGALGVIVDGRIRDLNEQREFGFPVNVWVVSCS